MPSHSGHLALSAAIIIAGAMISGSIWWSDTQLLLEARQIAETTAELLPAARQIADASARISEVAQRAPPANSQAAGVDAVQPPVDVADVATDGEPFVGSATAPVAMALWTDYQCPYCRQLETTVIPTLVTDYVNAGKLRIIFKDFQFLGADSQTAGLASRAVWEVAPDKFYTWHKAMFDHQDGENVGWGSKDDILALTKSISGIDAAKVEQFMTDHAAAYRKAMEADMAEGNAFGINGTPGAIVGKQLMVGAEPYAAFRAAIDAATPK